MSDVGLLAVEGLIGAAVVGGIATWALRADAGSPVAAEVQFPTDLTAVQVETLLGHIAGLNRTVAIAFTVDATADGLRFGVAAPYGPFHHLSAALRGIAPEARIEESESSPSGRFCHGVRLAWRGSWPLLRMDQPESAVAGLLGGFTGLRSRERLRLVVTVRPAGRVRGPQQRPATAQTASALERVGFGRPQLAAEELRAIRTKLAGPLLRVRIVVAADAASVGRAQHLLSRVATAVRSRQFGRGTFAVRRLTGK